MYEVRIRMPNCQVTDIIKQKMVSKHFFFLLQKEDCAKRKMTIPIQKHYKEI